ncbi:Facilitated trehalose transporter Tret1 [Eumeta japonica]|uniref:Facilitated trehalose transporter Tret1 n=1 Tax=Eumeta variegata TaxID=151549 RepID=A0A4C1VBK2_EUMVA|nr:Facilitated trehalose transporter Tret1 [Eumeta japonica]
MVSSTCKQSFVRCTISNRGSNGSLITYAWQICCALGKHSLHTRNEFFAQPRQTIWAAFGVLTNIASSGFHYGYPTVLFRDLRAKDSPIPLTLEEESWITSSAAVTTLLSFVLVAPLMERYGRKIAHISLIISNAMACVIFYFANNFTTLMLGRLLFGIPNGGSIVLTAIIIAEFTSPELRGILLNGKTCSIVFGASYAHLLGLFFDWRTLALFGLVLPVLSLLITITWPESPAWLARRGHYERCEKNFNWLRGEDPSAQKELHALIKAEMDRLTVKISDPVSKSFTQKIKKIFMKFTRRDFLKPTWIMANAFVIMETCGRHVFPTYAIKIVTAFAGGQSPLHYVLGLDLVIFATSLLACVVVHMFKRRTLLFSTGSICSVLLLAICLYLFLKSKQIIPSNNVWIPLTLFILYFFFLNLGTSPLVLTILGEIYPLKHRSMGVVMSGIFFSFALMVALKVTPLLIESIEVHGTFTIFAAFMIGSLLYLYFNLPETKDKTLQEIEEYFTNGKDRTQLAHDFERRLTVDNKI